jgi:TRAP-type C4-dicarboxylate transport system permease small subunit
MIAEPETRKPWPYRLADTAMAITLGVMAASVFVNVVLRYGFGSGVAASEELSRLLFVWMVFIGATAAYPLGEHMAFTSLLLPLRGRMGGLPLKLMTLVIHAFVLLACVLVGWGAWQQVVVGMDSKSVVLGYPAALLPLPAFLSAVAIGVMALVNLVRIAPINLGHESEVE